MSEWSTGGATLNSETITGSVSSTDDSDGSTFGVSFNNTYTHATAAAGGFLAGYFGETATVAVDSWTTDGDGNITGATLRQMGEVDASTINYTIVVLGVVA